MSTVTLAGDGLYPARRRHEFTAVVNGKTAAIPRSVGAASFRDMIGYREFPIDTDANYNAFPFAVDPMDGFIPFIYSSGPAHAESTHQRMRLFDCETRRMVPGSVDFKVGADTFDCSLLDDIMPVDSVQIFKTFRVRKIGATTYEAETLPELVHEDRTYNHKSLPKIISGTAYRTATAQEYDEESETPLVPVASRVSIFKSPEDDQLEWTHHKELFRLDEKRFNEADFAFRLDGTGVAFARESSGESLEGKMYVTFAANINADWETPVLCDRTFINGVQTRLIRLQDGSLFLMAGDRSGHSGYSHGGAKISYLLNSTGSCGWRLPPSAASTALVNWRDRTMFSGIRSTDGGQPWGVELPDGNELFWPSYGARNGVDNASIWGCIFRTSDL